MPRALLLLLLTCLATAAAAQSPEVKAERLRRTAEREARSDSSLGCKDLLAQTRLACREVFTRGLQASCQSLTTALKMSAQQASGKLFSTGDADKDARAAHASCRVHLRSLEKARKKSEGALTDAAGAPAECTALAEVLDRDCFDGFEQRGAFSPACEQVFSLANHGQASMAKFLGAKQAAEGKPAPDPATRCQVPLSVYRQLTKPTAPPATGP